MLDIEIAGSVSGTAQDIVTTAEMRRYFRLTTTRLDEVIAEALEDALSRLEAPYGDLNRTIRQTSWRMHLNDFPDLKNKRLEVVGRRKGKIALPYPPLISVSSIDINDGESPTTEVDSSIYTVKTGTYVGEIELNANQTWPSVTPGPRAITVNFIAGYVEYPALLKRLIKLFAGHYLANLEATINEPRVIQINRKLQFGADDLIQKLKVPVNYDDWGQ